MADVVQQNEIGLVFDPTAPKDIAAKVTAILDDRDALARMQSNARQAGIEKYNWELEETKLLNLYETL